jgi:DNA-binding transcriptional MerR regulator
MSTAGRGLIARAAEIDLASGYRFYVADQVPIAQVIRRFRDLDMPLDDIREVLGAPDVDARNKLRIVAHMRWMEARLAETQSMVASLRALLERPAASTAVEHRSAGPIRALAISEHVSASDLDAWWNAAFGALDAALAAATVPAASPTPHCSRSSTSSSRRARSSRTSRSRAMWTRPAGPGWWRSPRPTRRWRCTWVARPTSTGPTALGTYMAQREIGVAGPIRE